MDRVKSYLPVGVQALIISKRYYGVLSRWLESIEIDRYYTILYFLSSHDGCTQQEICNGLAVDKGAMVKVLDYLRKHGYVTRRVNPEDRREHIVRLTTKGKARAEKVVDAFERLDARVFRKTPKGKRKNFRTMMEALDSELRIIPGDELFFNYTKVKPEAARTSRTAKR
jgi:MarR family transcriptional regulator, transcriptional regulator for hemolysin